MQNFHKNLVIFTALVYNERVFAEQMGYVNDLFRQTKHKGVFPMNFNIALLRGDGIGPEIVDSAVAVLHKIGEKYGHTFTCTPYLIGGCAIDATGIPLPKETIDGCLASDSVLLGAVGGAVGHNKWDQMPPHPPSGKMLCWESVRLWDCLPTSVRQSCIRL